MTDRSFILQVNPLDLAYLPFATPRSEIKGKSGYTAFGIQAIRGRLAN
jgi:hypothetical protein